VTSTSLLAPVRRHGGLIAFFAAVLAVTGLALAADPAPAHALTDPASAEVQFLSLLNQARAANGLAPMARDGALDGVARDWSTHMAATFAGNGGVTIQSQRSEIDWRVTLAETGKSTMTGSRVKRIERYIGSDADFLLTYGDGVSDIDLRKLVALHLQHKPVVTVSGVRPPGRFGELDHDASGRITEFNEKPQALGGRISGGFFVCSRRLFDYLDGKRDDEVLEVEPFRRIAREGGMVMYSHDGFWQCMDTFRDYMLLNEMYDRGRAPWLTS